MYGPESLLRQEKANVQLMMKKSLTTCMLPFVMYIMLVAPRGKVASTSVQKAD